MAFAISEQSAAILPSLQPLWHRSAPQYLREGAPTDDPLGLGWRIWQDHLHHRKRPVEFPSLTKRKTPLLWGWPKDWKRDEVMKTITSRQLLAEVVVGTQTGCALDLPQSLQTVSLAYVLPRLARDLPSETWWMLVERLHETAAQAQALRVDWPADPRDVVRQQLLAGELPLALGYLFPELCALRLLRKAARESLSEAMLEVTDGQGLPDARLLPVLGPLFACWTRARWLGARTRRGPWSREAELQYQWLVRHAIRLADKGQRFLLTPTTSAPNSETSDNTAWNKRLFATAIELAGDNGDRVAANRALPRGVLSKQKKFRAAKLPDPSLNSDWAGITILASGWSQSDARLAVAFAADPMTIELSVAGKSLIRGAWTGETTCDGCPVLPIGDWEQLFWESRKRFDLFELGIELSDGLRLERQMLFARDERVLYIAEMILARDRKPRNIRHSFALPLAENARWQPERETRDGTIAHGKARAAVLPLALHEWRADPRGGSLEETAGRLMLTQEAHGSAICCPLLFDLDRKRSKKERTWRHLTVGENLEIVPNDRAVGFRAQADDDQWIFYRSLGPAGNRTVLGQNLAGEFCAGSFDYDGKFKEWIEVECG
jgi:hypothetical protein